MITSEEIINSLTSETGLKREDNSIPNMLSKPEMEYMLIYIINIKNKLKGFENKENTVKEIVEETIGQLGNKG